MRINTERMQNVTENALLVAGLALSALTSLAGSVTMFAEFANVAYPLIHNSPYMSELLISGGMESVVENVLPIDVTEQTANVAVAGLGFVAAVGGGVLAHISGEELVDRLDV